MHTTTNLQYVSNLQDQYIYILYKYKYGYYNTYSTNKTKQNKTSLKNGTNWTMTTIFDSIFGVFPLVVIRYSFLYTLTLHFEVGVYCYLSFLPSIHLVIHELSLEIHFCYIYLRNLAFIYSFTYVDNK